MRQESKEDNTSHREGGNVDYSVPSQSTEEEETVRTDLTALDPPPSYGEKLRDSILKTLDRPFFQVLNIIVIILVIASGALYFFLLMGWQTLCRPRRNCEARNWWYNWSIQVLTALFTYMVTVAMPWRSTNFLHLAGWGCPRRFNSPGHDLYGLPVENDIWFHIPLRRRIGITVILLLNCLTQYANQATHIKWYSFELRDKFPGSLWTAVFFVASFLCACIGGAWLAYEMWLLRRANPTQFGPGPVELARAFYKKHFSRKKKKKEEEIDPVSETSMSKKPG